jgi:hypothetical protein
MKHFILIAMLLTAGCSSSAVIEEKTTPIYHVYLDDSYSQEHKRMIEDAMSEWSLATNQKVQFNFEYAVLSDETVNLNQFAVIYIYNDFTPASGELGWTIWDNGINTAEIVIPDNIANTYFHTVALHELGHSLHLGHETDSNITSVMHPDVNDCNTSLTTDDVEKFNTIWNVK